MARRQIHLRYGSSVLPSGALALDFLIIGRKRVRRLPARTFDPPHVIRRNVSAFVVLG